MSSQLIGEELFKRMNQRLYHLVNQFQLITKTKEIQDLLSKSNTGKITEKLYSVAQEKEKDQIKSILENSISRRLKEIYFINYERQYGVSLFHNIIFTDNRGAPVSFVGEWQKDNFKEEIFWQTARDQGSYLKEVLEIKKGVTYNFLLIANKIFDNKGNFGGVLILVLDVKTIIRESEMATKKYSSTEVEIINGDYQLIYSTKPYRFLTDVHDKSYYRYINKKQTYIIYQDTVSKKLVSYTPAQGYKFFQGLNWSSVISHHLKEILIPYSKLTTQIIIVSTLFIIISIILLFLNLRIITKPLNSLLVSIREITNGKRNKRVKILHNDEFGELTSAFNAMLDKIINAENALRESEERLNLAILGTHAGLWDWDIRTGEIFVNERWAEILDYSLEEISPVYIEKLNELYHPDDLKKSNKLLQLHFSGALSHYECEIKIRKKNGEWVWILSRGKIANRDDNGKAIRMAGTIQDITHQKNIENEIRKLNIQLEDRVKKRTYQLEQSNAELEAFAYTVSHDLRAPLRSIDGFSRIILDEYYEKLDESIRHYLDRISAGSQRMGHLIDAILELSRATRRKMKWDKVNLSKLANETASSLQERDPDRVVEVDIIENVIAMGDAYLLTTVFENLIGNAWKFTNQLDKAKISFGVIKNKNKEIQYFIKDNGIGFNMKYIDNLFKPFKRLHSEKDFPGSGIGLANVQRMINKHGGKIWAKSGGKGKGATFYFTLSR